MHLITRHWLQRQLRGFKELSHPPYSRDLASCDFHVFPNLKDTHVGRTSRMTVIEVWLQEQAKHFILVERYNKFSFKMLGSELFVFPHLSLSINIVKYP